MPIQGIPHAVDWIEFLKERRERTADPSDIQKLTVFIDHLAGEYAHDWDSTMDTMLGAGVSRSWGGGAMLDMLGTPGADGTHELTNHDRRAFYQGMVAAGGESSFKFVAMDTQRCFVGEDGLAMDGMLWNLVPGDEVADWGGEIPDGADPSGIFAVGRRLALFMAYQDGKIVGEDTYWDARTETRHITEPVAIPALPQWLVNERKSQ